MKFENNEQMLSRSVLNSGAKGSLHGYLNTEEFMKSLHRGIGWTSFTSLGIAVAIALGESVHLWYTGPLAPTVVAAAGVIVGYLRTKKIGERLIDEGGEQK